MSERVVVSGHGCHTTLNFGVKAKKNKTRFLRYDGYLNDIKIYKARFLLTLVLFLTTELSKLLTFCLMAFNRHVIQYRKKVYERSGKNLIWSIKSSGEALDKLKASDFNTTSLSTYDFFYS